MSQRSLAALGLAATVLATAGCGGSGQSGGAASTAALTRSELLTKAEAICKRVGAERAATLSHLVSYRDYGALVPRMARYETAAAAELAKLQPPASLAADWAQIVAADRSLTNYLLPYGRDVASRDRHDAGVIARAVIRIQRPMIATVKRDGISDCAHFAWS